MPRYEYKVVPAPRKPAKVKGVKGTENRFAVELSTLMNTLGAEGWEYQRTDTLPVEERQGLTGRTTTFQNMLVFRRELSVAVAVPDITPVAIPESAPEPEIVAELEPLPEPAVAAGALAAEPEIAAEEPSPVLSFRPANADAPRLSTQPEQGEAPQVVPTEAPEGKAPSITFRPKSGVAAQ